MRFHLLALLAIGAIACGDKEAGDTGDGGASAEGVPDIDLGSRGLIWGELAPGETRGEELRILNRGDGILTVSSITSDDAAFYPGSSGASIPAGDEFVLTVYCEAPADYTTHTAILTISSNDPDPDEQSLTVNLECGVLSDADNDGFDSLPAGGNDCDDTDSAINPDAPDDWYDGIDSNCDEADEYDQDQDGYQSIIENEDPNAGGGDCQDANPDMNPGATDVWYDGVDSDCSGNDDYDQDEDGSAAAAYGQGEDCDDTNFDINTGAIEKINGADDDCDGEIDVDVSAWNADYVFVGAAASDQAGWSLAVGDMNADGYDDLMVGAPAYDADFGLVGVFDGNNLPATGSTLLDGTNSFAGASGHKLGSYVAFQELGKSGDPTIAVGASGYNSGAGAVYLIQADLAFYTGTTSNAYLQITGESGNALGAGMAQNLDLNGDGVEDLFGRYKSGSSTYLWLNYGGAQGVLDLPDVDARFSTSGSSVIPEHSFPVAGDLNGDGEDDAVYCDHKVNSRGAVYILWGQTTRYDYASVESIDNVATKLFEGEPYEQLGRTCGVGPDWNGDGNDELWVQVPDSSGNISGIYMIAGSDELSYGGARPEEIYERYYVMRDSDPGAYAFGRIGDWDADGVGDVAFGLEPSGVSFGRAYLYGSDTPNTGTLDDEGDAVGTLEGDDDFYQEFFGSAISPLPGDFNGDGLHDFVGGDYGYDGLSGTTDDVGGVFISLQLP